MTAFGQEDSARMYIRAAKFVKVGEELFPHLQLSLNLDPSDSLLFPNLKKWNARMKFGDKINSLANAYFQPTTLKSEKFFAEKTVFNSSQNLLTQPLIITKIYT